MSTWMAEIREQITNQDQQIAALLQAVATPVSHGTSHPTRAHDLLLFEENNETLSDFFERFERYCATEYRGTLDDALPLLRSKLSGRVRDIFDANGPRSSYPVIKRRMLEWSSRRYEPSSATEAYRDAARRPGEPLAVFAFRLAALFEDAYPNADKQVSDDLRRKLLSTLPTSAADFLRRQLRYALTNHDTSLRWDGLVLFLECERFESEEAWDSLHVRTAAEHHSRPASVRRPLESSRARTMPPRPRPVYGDPRSSADESDTDSDSSRRSTSLPRGAREPRGASARRHRAPGAVQPRSPVRGRHTDPPRCGFCRRRGHTEHECRRANDLCFQCGSSGHFARDCPSARADGTVPSSSGRLRRPASPRPSNGSRHGSSSPARMHEERGDQRVRHRGGRVPAHQQSGN